MHTDLTEVDTDDAQPVLPRIRIPVAPEPLQTVSLKLPRSMAVLVVPVHLSSMTDDESMQLQQIGKRVAIIRGSLTNVAEFQVLPSLFDGTEEDAAAEMDIRQIVCTEDGPESGPTIRITPEERPQLPLELTITEDDFSARPETPHAPPPPPPLALPTFPPPVVRTPAAKASAPKNTLKSCIYIEGICCGRCFQPFEDLPSLAEHQRTEHKMPTIYGSLTAPPATSQTDSEFSLDEAQIANKIAQRGLKRPKSGVRSQVPRKTKAKGRRFVCPKCSLTFYDQGYFDAHLEWHREKREKGADEVALKAEEEEEEAVTATETTTSLAETEVSDDELVRLLKPFRNPTTMTALSNRRDSGPIEHVITDASGNQIVVHADTQEELQEILSSLDGTLQAMGGHAVREVIEGPPAVHVEVFEEADMGESVVESSSRGSGKRGGR